MIGMRKRELPNPSLLECELYEADYIRKRYGCAWFFFLESATFTYYRTGAGSKGFPKSGIFWGIKSRIFINSTKNFSSLDSFDFFFIYAPLLEIIDTPLLFHLKHVEQSSYL